MSLVMVLLGAPVALRALVPAMHAQAATPHSVRISNGAITAMVYLPDRPLDRVALWSIRSVLALEPFVAMNIVPGGDFTWQYTYRYFTIP